MSRMVATLLFVVALVLAGPVTADIGPSHSSGAGLGHMGDPDQGQDHHGGDKMPHCGATASCAAAMVLQRTAAVFVVPIRQIYVWPRRDDRIFDSVYSKIDPPVPRLVA